MNNELSSNKVLSFETKTLTKDTNDILKKISLELKTLQTENHNNMMRKNWTTAIMRLRMRLL